MHHLTYYITLRNVTQDPLKIHARSTQDPSNYLSNYHIIVRKCNYWTSGCGVAAILIERLTQVLWLQCVPAVVRPTWPVGWLGGGSLKDPRTRPMTALIYLYAILMNTGLPWIQGRPSLMATQFRDKGIRQSPDPVLTPSSSHIFSHIPTPYGTSHRAPAPIC